MENLWPDISVEEKVETPRNILAEQAQYLSEQNKNKIRGDLGVGRTGTGFLCEFHILAPSLGYRTKLFSVTYNLIDIYPAEINLDVDLAQSLIKKAVPTKIVAHDRKEFVTILGQIFNAEPTIRILKALKQHLE